MASHIGIIAEAMVQMVENDQGSKKYKPKDLYKAIMKEFSPEEITRTDCKDALRSLIDSGQLAFSNFGASSLEIPSFERTTKSNHRLKSKQRNKDTM